MYTRWHYMNVLKAQFSKQLQKPVLGRSVVVYGKSIFKFFLQKPVTDRSTKIVQKRSINKIIKFSKYMISTIMKFFKYFNFFAHYSLTFWRFWKGRFRKQLKTYILIFLNSKNSKLLWRLIFLKF